MFTFGEFESWLSSLPDDVPVGVSCLAGACPISVWATGRMGITVQITPTTAIVAYEDGDMGFPLDKGLSSFVDYVDERWPNTEISAGQARLACRAVRESLNS